MRDAEELFSPIYMSKGKITKIEGRYFRSRTEGTWAAVLHAFDVPFDYEPKTFRLANSISYVPDFYIPDLSIWIEIKASVPDDAEVDKIIQLARITGCPAFIFAGLPICQIFSDGEALTGFEISSALPHSGNWDIHGKGTCGERLHEILAPFPSVKACKSVKEFERITIQAARCVQEDNFRMLDELLLEDLVRSQPWFRINQ
jgi:hypothetical protein